MLALCGVKAEEPTSVTWGEAPVSATRPATWNGATFNRNVDSCSECTNTLHPNGNGAMEDCIKQYWYQGVLYEYDGYVCVPFGCKNAATPNFATYAATHGELGTPEHFCSGSTEQPRNAVCIPEPVQGAPNDPTMLFFFSYCLCLDGYVGEHDNGGVPINFECTSSYENECDSDNNCDRRSDCIELTNENDEGYRCDCKDGFEAGGELRQVSKLTFRPFHVPWVRIRLNSYSAGGFLMSLHNQNFSH